MMGEKGNRTNLASEFYVLSVLHRLGVNALLTLGNKKAVDILVWKGDRALTIDVKGIKGASGFPFNNGVTVNGGHYYVFVSFLGKMEDPSLVPEVYVVPSKDIEKKHGELEGGTLVWKGGNRKVIPLGKLKKLANLYRDNWKVFL
ncbi:MAG: hypothetical protein LBP81_02995 [Treponema sp.]|jgi:hypothetical protein|nr:hypothetical protein [Treponema sp.]